MEPWRQDHQGPSSWILLMCVWTSSFLQASAKEGRRTGYIMGLHTGYLGVPCRVFSRGLSRVCVHVCVWLQQWTLLSLFANFRYNPGQKWAAWDQYGLAWINKKIFLSYLNQVRIFHFSDVSVSTPAPKVEEGAHYSKSENGFQLCFYCFSNCDPEKVTWCLWISKQH